MLLAKLGRHQNESRLHCIDINDDDLIYSKKWRSICCMINDQSKFSHIEIENALFQDSKHKSSDLEQKCKPE